MTSSVGETELTGSTDAMTQQPQDEFDSSVESAQEWMKAVQERLQVNDNTQGPRAALEARLRETEKICRLEPEGQMKMDLVLKSADTLLGCCSEEQKHKVLARLKDIKTQWEETVIYITHCHSRIEWVWLHWSEYLLAQDEFYRWFQKIKMTLETSVELQVGLKEKQWQLSHSQVLLNNILNQSILLDRLLEEAASLFNRIGDPSVDEDVQKRMKGEYEKIKAQAQERVSLLEKITKEHEQYKANVDQFQLWLNGVMEKVNTSLGRRGKMSAKHQLKTLQNFAKDFQSGEKSLKKLKDQSAGVIQNTSPKGGEKITNELEELRKTLEKLKLFCKEEEERSLKTLKSEGAYETQAKQLEAEVRGFRKELQRLAEDLEPGEKARDEAELIAHWRIYSATRSALAAEEPKAERLKSQLKELVRFNHDLQPLSDSVVTTMQEFQRVKENSSKLRNRSGTDLWQCFQHPVQEFQLWKALAQRLLAITDSLPDLPSIHTFLPQIEAALAESSRLKEQLIMLKLKKDLLISIFGEERAQSFLEEVDNTIRERDLLHNNLLQRNSKLQSAISQHNDFDTAFEPLQKRLADLHIRAEAEKAFQQDLPSKQAQLQRLQRLQEGLQELEIQIENLKPLVQANPRHQHQISQLSSDYQTLKRSLEITMEQSQQHVREHWTFNHKLSELQQWIGLAKQKLESYQGDEGQWKVDGQSVEDIEMLVAEFPDKEVQLHLIEAHGQLVMETSSLEGAALVQGELKELTESWKALKLLQETLLSLIRKWQLKNKELDPVKKLIFSNNIPKHGFLIDSVDSVPRHRGKGSLSKEEEESNDDFSKLLKDFEQWLKVENAKLVKTVAMKNSNAKDSETRKDKLKELQDRLPEGQHLFESLLRLRPKKEPSEDLEDLRYRWMLYKSKLQDSSHLLEAHSPLGKPVGFRKSRPGGLCPFLHRVCCVALPLQLLLLSLLLLLLLLPLGQERWSCAFSNNFARSFKLMLRYEGPPPT
ncbi:nesprin-3 isoform X1 [Trichosurus vulpecula]|uniref:nesprin-3 isoform X1 n=2 Tax=Trichosurus vulpecula TaxID=9337 RepID=UPI00186AC041|nr:nesprin-3 isoform X1 [Trichosurus vulpecula]